MAFFSETLALPENAFLILRDLIMDKTGIYFEDSKRDILADKLSGRVLERGFTSFLDYYYFLKYDQGTEDEWNKVFDLITVRETYFWREYDHIEALMRFILPLHAGNPGKFRIWCAACSTGEEPLSLALALHDAGWFEKMRIEILASDASLQSLEHARRGVYRERSVRHIPEELLRKYFKQENGLWRISPAIHCIVSWKQINLNDESQRDSVPVQNVIFCRNVFIYFREETIFRITAGFYRKLTSPGYLFVGVSESLFRVRTQFELSEIGTTFVYRKE